jgi:hypothetical protein
VATIGCAEVQPRLNEIVNGPQPSGGGRLLPQRKAFKTRHFAKPGWLRAIGVRIFASRGTT